MSSLRTIDLGDGVGQCAIISVDKDLNNFKEITDSANVTQEERNIRTLSRFQASQTNTSLDELEFQSEQMISRRRFGPAVRCLCLALSKLHSAEPIYKMESSKLICLLKLYSKRALSNLKLAQNMTRNSDKKRFLEKVKEDCNFTLHIGIFKKEFLESQQEIQTKLIEIESSTIQLLSSLENESTHAVSSESAQAHGRSRRRNRPRF